MLSFLKGLDLILHFGEDVLDRFDVHGTNTRRK